MVPLFHLRDESNGNLPPIVFGLTGNWAIGKRIDIVHAVVVLRRYYDGTTLLNEWANRRCPGACWWNEFMLAWSEQDYIVHDSMAC